MLGSRSVLLSAMQNQLRRRKPRSLKTVQTGRSEDPES